MPVDVGNKKASWVRRIVADGIAAVDAVRKSDLTASEYSTDAFNGGDPTNRPEYTITDQDLIDAGFPHLDAAKLNTYIGGLAAIKSAYDANAGVIEAARP